MQVRFEVPVKGIEQVMSWTIGANEDVFAIVAEFQARPSVARLLTMSMCESAFGFKQVECGEGRLVEVAEVVKEDA